MTSVRLKLKLSQILMISIALGIAASFYTRQYLQVQRSEPVANDFTWHWLASRALIEGRDPYQVVRPGGPYNLNAGYLYPLPAALITMPFAAGFGPVTAAALFVGFSVFLLSFAVARNNPRQLAMFGGIPLFWAVSAGQLSIIAVAGTLLPGLGWLAVVKPNLAPALLFYRPSRSFVIGGVAVVLVSMFIQPSWIGEWLALLRNRTAANYGSPLRIVGGPLLLLAVVRWRRPEARLLLIMSMMPQSLLYYDQLLLGLVPRSGKEAMILVITGFIGYVAASARVPADATPAVASAVYGPAILFTLYLPALIMVLRRPNEREAQ